MADSPWVMVTGSTSPLGTALCRELAKAGYSLILHYCHREDLVLSLAEECYKCGVSALPCQGDFSSSEKTKTFLTHYAAFGVKIWHLINNASLYFTGSLLETLQERWEILWQCNFLAPMMLIQTLIPQIQACQGSIINIGVAGLERSLANTYNPAYVMTKAALLQATRSLAKELAHTGVRLNVLSPGHLPHSVDVALFPHTHVISLEFVVDAALFLLSSKASAITGQNVEIAAGSFL